MPRGSWKQQQRQQWDRQQQWERPRGRGRAAGGTDPIITTADGWEEVAQDDPYTDRCVSGWVGRLLQENSTGITTMPPAASLQHDVSTAICIHYK